MTRDEMLRMARQAGLVSAYGKYDDWIEAGPSGDDLMEFTKLVAAKEREECAKIVEESSLPDVYSEPCLLVIAEEIRARGES